MGGSYLGVLIWGSYYVGSILGASDVRKSEEGIMTHNSEVDRLQGIFSEPRGYVVQIFRD